MMRKMEERVGLLDMHHLAIEQSDDSWRGGHLQPRCMYICRSLDANGPWFAMCSLNNDLSICERKLPAPPDRWRSRGAKFIA